MPRGRKKSSSSTPSSSSAASHLAATAATTAEALPIHSKANSSSNNNNTSNHTNSQESLQAILQAVEEPPALASPSAATSGVSSLTQAWQSDRAFILVWLGICFVGGSLVGFWTGAGQLDGLVPALGPWRQHVGHTVRAWSLARMERIAAWAWEFERDWQAVEYANNPSHPHVFAVLREAVVREKGGYVHPDLGFLVPAPSGASRGVGMVKSAYHACQTKCLPGIAQEKLAHQQEHNETLDDPQPLPNFTSPAIYRQEEVLIRVPLAFQMTRQTALDTLTPRIPDAQKRQLLHELDDAALLTLQLAHERSVGRYSRWMPYLASLPLEPSCGYRTKVRPSMLDAVAALREERGMHTQGWSEELIRASQYAQRIVQGLHKDFGTYLAKPPTPVGSNDKEPDADHTDKKAQDAQVLENLDWALCHVASRATAGSERHGGSLRLVPLVDGINHDVAAGGFVELTGQERLAEGDFVDATEDDAGTFVVRSVRHGKRKPLKEGQELLVNYNVPHYSPLDWLVSLGFVPTERQTIYHKVDPVLPRTTLPRSQWQQKKDEDIWNEHEPALLEQLRTEL